VGGWRGFDREGDDGGQGEGGKGKKERMKKRMMIGCISSAPPQKPLDPLKTPSLRAMNSLDPHAHPNPTQPYHR
jgi:hypothetical protein